jgi:fatty acid desaturase
VYKKVEEEMNPRTKLKIIGGFFALLLLANLILAATLVINWLVFWLVLIIIAAISYWGIPWLKRTWIK